MTDALDLPIKNNPGKRPLAVSVSARFEKFWASVGKKVEKKAAEAEFRRLNPDDELLDKMIAAMGVYSRARALEYQKSPHRWIKGECWDDELHTVASNGDTPTATTPHKRYRTEAEETRAIVEWQCGRAPKPDWYNP